MAQAKIPKPYRRKNFRGKEQGSYYCKVRGEEINLATKDPDEAWRRAAAAKRDNKRNFKEDAEAAADAAIEARTKPITPPTPPVDELAAARAAAAAAAAPPPTPADRSPPAPEAPAIPASAAPPAPSQQPSEGAPSPPTPQASSPPSNQASSGHEKVEEAAREATQQRDSTEAPPPPPPPPGMQFDPAFIAMMAKQGAESIVSLQLMLQGWIVFKRTGDKPGKVPREAIEGPMQIWEHQLKVWIARWSLDSIPPWAVAIFLTTMCYPIQNMGRQKRHPAGNLGSVQDAEWTEAPPVRKAA
jgi:hypothetical protein